jgi:hypothetical protein
MAPDAGLAGAGCSARTAVRSDPGRTSRSSAAGAGDLDSGVAELADRAPSGAALVLFHSAVLAYLSPADQARFVATVTGLPGLWISNEGSSVDLRHGETLPTPADPTTSVFVLRKEPVAVGYAGGHGQFLHWFG